ncbi:MAG: type III pantothenate kinase [Candidatus Margulisiibacteriota bacterium]
MLLAIDIGNTNIVFGVFAGKKIVKQWRVSTPKTTLQSLPAIKGIDQILVASVVPSLDKSLAKLLVKKYGVKPHFVTASNIPGVRIRMRNKNEVGADRVVDALAAYKLYGGPVIVVDFGTATTFDVINAKGEYLGGAIAPGILLARDALHAQTAKLPRIELKAPRSVIGNNTVEAIRSGLVLGYVSLVEGMIKRIKKELIPPSLPKRGGRGVSYKVIATGGLAPLICKQTGIVDIIDENLTLKGLMLCQKN